MDRKIAAIALGSLLATVKELYGEPQLEGVINCLSPPDRKAVLDPANLQGRWVSLDLIMRLAEAAAKAIFGGDESRLRELGRHEIQRDFVHGSLGIFVRFTSPKLLAKAVPSLGRILYKPAVRMEAKFLTPQKGLLRLYGVEARYRLLEFIFLGQVEGGLLAAGVKDPQAEVTKSLADGEGLLEITVSWE